MTRKKKPAKDSSNKVDPKNPNTTLSGSSYVQFGRESAWGTYPKTAPHLDFTPWPGGTSCRYPRETPQHKWDVLLEERGMFAIVMLERCETCGLHRINRHDWFGLHQGRITYLREVPK